MSQESGARDKGRSTRSEVGGTRRAGSKESGVKSKGAGLDPKLIRSLVEVALSEDRAERDITTDALVPSDQLGRALLIAKSAGVLVGVGLAEAVFRAVDGSLRFAAAKADGSETAPGDTMATVEGSLHSILRAERVALNFIAHLSGVASATATIVALLKDTECRLRDTRKTTPGLRALEKYAVWMGGGTNHRFDLSDGVLIKDNHLAALRARELDIPDAVELARKTNPGMPIEVEVTSVEEARRAMEAGADELLLDNMSLKDMADVVHLARKREPRPLLEASGGITVISAPAIAETGVDFISMGAITHSAPAVDLSLEVVSE